MKKIKVSKEALLYISIWLLIFLSPIMSFYFHSTSFGEDFEWDKTLIVWHAFAIYLIIFLVHDLILAPMLIYRHRRVSYLVMTLLLIGVFGFYQCENRPELKPQPAEKVVVVNHDGNNHPPIFFGPMDVVGTLILIGLIGLNLGIKLYFKNERDQKNLAELERKNLFQQLQYLKYQINPHFFMNTLNNIHALVDIDPEKAKTSIVELSKMMRYVLYEGNRPLIPLKSEVVFLDNYVRLMMLRYTDNVSVDVDIPANMPPAEIPPLLLITFVENAFKHGISYEHESFVNISMDIDGGQLLFTCINSKQQATEADGMPKEGGVGLKNVGQRLKLIYGNSYSLDIVDGDEKYSVALRLPLKTTLPPQLMKGK